MTSDDRLSPNSLSEIHSALVSLALLNRIDYYTYLEAVDYWETLAGERLPGHRLIDDLT